MYSVIANNTFKRSFQTKIKPSKKHESSFDKNGFKNLLHKDVLTAGISTSDKRD